MHKRTCQVTPIQFPCARATCDEQCEERQAAVGDAKAYGDASMCTGGARDRVGPSSRSAACHATITHEHSTSINHTAQHLFLFQVDFALEQLSLLLLEGSLTSRLPLCRRTGACTVPPQHTVSAVKHITQGSMGVLEVELAIREGVDRVQRPNSLQLGLCGGRRGGCVSVDGRTPISDCHLR